MRSQRLGALHGRGGEAGQEGRLRGQGIGIGVNDDASLQSLDQPPLTNAQAPIAGHHRTFTSARLVLGWA